VDFALGPDVPDEVTVAALVAAARAGVRVGPRAGACNAWWHAGIADAVERYPAVQPRPAAYEAARSPRNTRGAMRA
jgi:hypothetical protein